MYTNRSYAEELKVVVLSDEEGYFAQGLEIDYGAEGPYLTTVKASFEAGLAVLVRQHMSAHGNLDRLLIPTPADTWAELWDSDRVYTVSSVSLSARVDFEGLPFTGISYFEQMPWAAKVSPLMHGASLQLQAPQLVR